MTVDEVRQPGDRREREDRRTGGERRRGGRRTSDTEGRFALIPALWATIGAVVVGYLFFLVLGNVKPSEAPAASIAALVLAVVWLAHAWRRVFVGSKSPTSDRERRGF
jgi:hypothetical protein